MHNGLIIDLAPRAATIRSEMKTELLTNLKLTLLDEVLNEITTELYVKVTEISKSGSTFKVDFTSVPPEAEPFLVKFLALQKKG